MAGAEVALGGRHDNKNQNRIEKIEKTGGKAYFIKGDVTEKNSIQAILDGVIEKSGKCEILVNGAGINSATPFLEVPEEEFDQIFSTNSKAIFLTCQVFGKYFIENSINASIINVGSMSGLIPLSRVFTYSMTKAAVHNISKNLAREWATKNIRVNAISAGPIKTLAASAIGDAKFLYKWNEDHSFLKRNVDIHDVGNSALYLLSNLANGVTGEIHYVDAGYNKVGMPDPKNIS